MNRVSAKPGRQAVALAALAAILISVLGFLATDLEGWYQTLVTPSWQPPDWLFGPIWMLIYSLTALAGVLAWHNAPEANARSWILALFALNGFLNVLWSLLFFRLQRPDLALAEIFLLWLSIVALIVGLRAFSKTTTWLLLPYLAWVTFAGVLNAAVVRLNPAF
ncbi:MAG TPA: TspO/MBR family protein [Wenzhouxiangella sp.]|nr:TspO/MBR family protein [Wenzhouxiangella sp.]